MNYKVHAVAPNALQDLLNTVTKELAWRLHSIIPTPVGSLIVVFERTVD